MAQLICEHVTLGYDGRAVISDLSFSVCAGDYLCIVGENGSGKTTLMKAILHLQAPLSGTIQTGDGLDRHAIGYLPQQSQQQRDFPASVREIVLSGCLNSSGLSPFYSKAQKERAHRNMVRLGIDGLARQAYRELSGGQQQRVLLARALCAANHMLLLDEPATGLDPTITEELYALIRSLNDEGMTIVMISHDVQHALREASHILHLGKAQFFGTTQAYLLSPVGSAYANGQAVGA